MYVVTLSVFHNLAIWLLYVNKPEPEHRLTLSVTLNMTRKFCSTNKVAST